MGWSRPTSTSSSRPNRFGRKMMLCVWWVYKLLKSGETVNAHRYHQQLKLHRIMREKRPHYRKRHDKLIFLHDNAHIVHINNDPKLLEDTQLESGTPSRLLIRPGIFWLSPVFVDGQRAGWAALRFLRRRPKMAWVVCLERWGIFLAWYTNYERWEKCIVSERKYFE